ncbi:hypothetical protein AWENTII_010824 [Aspergillus wentii]
MWSEEGRKLLSIQLNNLGDEVIQDIHRKRFSFSHEPVTIDFDYDSGKVLTPEQAVSTVLFTRQNIQNGHYICDRVDKSTTAPLGPFTTWRISIESDDKVNPGLILDGVTGLSRVPWHKQTFIVS